MKNGLTVAVPAEVDVIRERRRQIAEEGYTAAHDDRHPAGMLARAGASFALGGAAGLTTSPPHELHTMSGRLWPFDRQAAPKAAPRRKLVIAAALILAEIERLDRADVAAAGAT
jgi:hypothetical protein